MVDDEDFDFLNRHVWKVYKGYAVTAIAGNNIPMHRLVHGSVPTGFVVDHKDRIKLNNMKHNLRTATTAQNSYNAVYGHQGKMIGVSKHRTKFLAKTSINNRTVSIGVYPTEEEAGVARDEVVYNIRGDFAVLNFPENIDRYKTFILPERIRKYL